MSTITVKDGTQIFYKDWGNGQAFKDTSREFPSMILVHGLGCNHTFLAEQARYFKGSHRVVSVDLRGHGSSDSPPGEYTMNGCVHFGCYAIGRYGKIQGCDSTAGFRHNTRSGSLFPSGSSGSD